MRTIYSYEQLFLRLPGFPPGVAALDLMTRGPAPAPGRSMIVDLASAVDQPRRFDTRLAILLREDLATWQKLNVTAFLVSGIVAAVDGITGDPYEDADGTRYLPMIREPITVLAGDRAELTDAHRRAVDRGLLLTIFTEELFSTPDDQANRAAVRAVPRDHLHLVGIGVYGPRGPVDKALRGARLHE